MKPVLALSLIPLAVALCALLVHDLRRLRAIGAVGGAAQVAATLWISVPVLMGGDAPSFLSWFHLDGMAAWVASVNALVYGASMVSAALLLDRPDDLHLSVKGSRALLGLSSLFVIAANAVVCANDLGAMWVAMEATTLVTAPMILLHGTRKSIEAAWKYLILCGVGIAFALLGTVFLLASAGEGGNLNLVWLTAHAGTLTTSLLNAGFVFFVLGYGTKAGLFPLHSWLPDAHSEAPAPASALLSGALLNCAMVALWRIGGIVEASTSPNLLPSLLEPMGAISVLAAGLMLVRQQNLKRMFAYSSVENMGLLAVAVGLGAAPIFALHALAHSVGKCAAFLLSGNVLRCYGTVALGKLGGVMRRTPALGFALLGAGAAVMGAPPSATFVSEWLLLSAAGDARHWGVFAAVAVGLAASFVAVMVYQGKVALGSKSGLISGAGGAGSIVPALLLLAVSVVAFLSVGPGAVGALDAALRNGGPR